MKSKILSRPMFQKAMDPENVGIMHGFKDSMKESLKDAMEDEYEGPENENDDEESESGKMIGRTPRSPEILMNTLRGDMRSPSARRKELADLVGEEAAMETPEEVLTLLQSKLGQGIASVPGQPSAGSPVPGGATPPPPPPSGAGAAPLQPGASPMAGLAGLGEQLQAAGVAAPAAPPMGAPAPGAGPTAPGPLNMADGGEVSYERYYAGGGAVEKKNESTPDIKSFLKPDSEAIKRGMADYSSLYADVLGDPKQQQSFDKALMLAQIAQRGFNFAANVSPTGAPLTGSFAARAAGAFGDVPGILLEGTKNQREREQKLKLAAFEAAREDESASRKLLGELTIAGIKRQGKPGKIFTATGPGGVTRQVQQASDGTGYLDMAGNQTDIGTGEMLSELPRGGSQQKFKPVSLWDTAENTVYGRGIVNMITGEVTTIDGASLPPSIVPVNFSPSNVGYSAKSQQKFQQESADRRSSVIELAQATRDLMDQTSGTDGDPETSRAALTKVVSGFASGLDNVKYELAALPMLLGMGEQSDPGDVLAKANELANIESYNWGNLSSANSKLKQGILFVALKSAKAQGLGTGSNLSNKDVQRSVDMLSGNTSNPDVFIGLLDNNLNLITDNYLSRENGRLVSPEERNAFLQSLGYRTQLQSQPTPPPSSSERIIYNDEGIKIIEQRQ
jgi:hypothetical protein